MYKTITTYYEKDGIIYCFESQCRYELFRSIEMESAHYCFMRLIGIYEESFRSEMTEEMSYGLANRSMKRATVKDYKKIVGKNQIPPRMRLDS